MKLATFTPAYLPSMDYFWRAAQADHIIYTDHFQYVKRSLSTISAPLDENKLLLRIPVLHDKKRLPLSEKRIDYSAPWHKKHFKSIHHLFHELPYAYHYLPQIKAIFDKEIINLSDFLNEWQVIFLKWLQLPVKSKRASEIGFRDQNEAVLLFWCHKYSAKGYITQKEIFKKGWVDQELLEKKGIQCSTFAPMPEAHILTSYKDLSILNFLLQFGPEAGYLIRQYLPE